MDKRGFSLVEVAVAIAVLAILAGALVPLAGRAINQRKAAATRRSLQAAFEAMFGSRERRVANMRADFGFSPTKSCTLECLVAKPEEWSGLPAFAKNGGASFFWGYNGPYWLGPTVGGKPADAWGHPIQLVCENDAWQVRSLGPDGKEGKDDLVYPPVPVPAAAYKATILVVITKASQDISGTVTLCNGQPMAGLKLSPFDILDQQTQSRAFTAPAGAMELRFAPANRNFTALTIPMEIPAGVTREVAVTL